MALAELHARSGEEHADSLEPDGLDLVGAEQTGNLDELGEEQRIPRRRLGDQAVQVRALRPVERMSGEARGDPRHQRDRLGRPEHFLERRATTNRAGFGSERAVDDGVDGTTRSVTGIAVGAENCHRTSV